MSNEKTYPGSCFCGVVQFTVSGEPAGMGYCHCESCRSWSAAIPDFPYRAGIHLNYQETKLHLFDGLPKLKDMPKEMGGSGISIAE